VPGILAALALMLFVSLRAQKDTEKNLAFREMHTQKKSCSFAPMIRRKEGFNGNMDLKHYRGKKSTFDFFKFRVSSRGAEEKIHSAETS
jgi:hypothetical protein